LKDTPFRVYGWIENSFTGNPGVRTNGENFGVNPNHLANQWMGNQYYLALGRPLQQTDSVNFGFRADLLFGNDWQFNHMQGLFNSAWPLNWFPGFDPAQFYASVHLPILTPKGLDIIGGRWYTIAGFEGVPAVSRPLLSVPYMFNYGQPFTHFGMLSRLHLSDHVKLFNGTINGWDRWVDQHYIWGYIGGLSWDSKDGRDHFALTGIWGPNQFPRFLGANQEIYPTGYVNIPSLAGLPNPGYKRNDRTLLTWVFSRKWTEKLVQTIETDQGWERSIPGLASGGLNGAPASDQWYSFGNWFLYSFNDELTAVWRSEWFRDVAGSRTGFPGNFYEMTLGLVIKPEPRILIRPEVRFDWSQFCHPFDNGTKSHQLTLGMDVIFRF
jgi:Putative beta-barrel porin-2, OmpL-like. bbp2